MKAFLEDDLFVVCSLFLFALFLRLSFLPHLVLDPAFIQPIVDSKEHNWLAHELINLNHWRITEIGVHMPGYAYFVAFVYKILGFSVVRLAVVQYILGSLCACLVFSLTKRLINRPAGIVAGIFMSVYWMLIYTQSHIFSENLSIFLNLLTIYYLVFGKDSWWKFLICGVLLGLSILVRPEKILFAGILWVWLISKKLPVKAIIGYYLIFIVGVSLCVAPLLVRHYQISKNLRLQKMIGLTLYVGSMPEYKGSNIFISAVEWPSLIGRFYLEQGENFQDREPTEAEFDSFYISKTFEYTREHPFQWAGFMAGKFASVLTGIDYLRSEDVYFYDQHIRGGPLALVQTWLICILALLGIIFSTRHEPRKYLLLLLFLASYLPALLFNYKSRYLMTHIPLLIIFSSYALSFLYNLARQKRLESIAPTLCFALALCTFVAWNPMNITRPSKAEAYHIIGTNFLYTEDLKEAEQYFLKTLEADPTYIVAYNDLGVIYMLAGKFTLAANIFQRALGFMPHPLFRNNYQTALRFIEDGGTYDQRANYPEEERKSTEIYHHFFPYPYQGAIRR